MFCNRFFSRVDAMNRHVKNCKLRIEKESEMQLESMLAVQRIQFEQQIVNLEQQIRSLRDQHERELKVQSDLVQMLQSQIFEIAKQPKVMHKTEKTTNNNQRTLNIVNQLAPYNLTKESIESSLLQHFTEETFYNGPPAIAKVVIEHVLTDADTGRRLVVCTDSSRKKIRYTLNGADLKDDVGMTKTTNLITPSLRQANVRIYNEIHTSKRMRLSTDDVYLRNSEFLKDKSQLATNLIGHLGTNVYSSSVQSD